MSGMDAASRGRVRSLTLLWFAVVGLVLLGGTGCGRDPSLASKDREDMPAERPDSPPASTAGAQETDTLPELGEPANRILSDSKEIEAYYVISTDTDSMVVTGPGLDRQIDRAYPVAFSPGDLLVYVHYPEGYAPGIWALDLATGRSRQLTNTSVEYVSGPTPSRYVPPPISQDVLWLDNDRFEYTVLSNEGDPLRFSVNLRTGAVSQ